MSRRTIPGPGLRWLGFSLTILPMAAIPSPELSPVPLAARPLPLTDVRLTGGPLKHAQDRNRDYLLALDPSRMLAYFRLRAGLPAGAEPYGGWDGGGRNLTGHLAGHYLSAVSLMYASTGEAEFKKRADDLVRGLREVQRAHGDGYLGALEGGREKFAEVARGDIRSGGFDLNGLWAPWYVQHKIHAGLRDAWRHTGNREALDAGIELAAWVEKTLAGLDGPAIQKMLATEFGGMNEVFVDLAADTGDTRWLALSRKFEHEAVVAPLREGRDQLAGIHANTQVPKLVGSLARHLQTGDPADRAAAAFFWKQVARHHSYATGGHGKDEYFGEPDRLADRVDGRTAESCNVYNMLKLTRGLLALDPEAGYPEFHERALFNHVLASMDPADGRTSYMVPVGRAVRQEYQDMFHSFTCCVGSGMENHTLHSSGLYSTTGTESFWIHLYAPSTARWRETGAEFTCETGFPLGEKAVFTLALPEAREFTVRARRPAWCGEGFAIRINGEPADADSPRPGGHATLRRLWKNGDTIEVTLPKSPRLEPLPDNPDRVALLWGPLVLAGDLGPEHGFAAWEPGAIPVFVGAKDRPIREWLRPVEGEPGVFRTEGVGRPREMTFRPFYLTHRRTYGIYWDLFSEEGWKTRAAEYEAERERIRKLEAATIAFVQPGEMQPERDFNQAGEESRPDRAHGRACRRALKWFSFDMPVDGTGDCSLVVTYNSDEWRPRVFEVLADGRKLAAEKVERDGPPRFFDRTYPLPPEITRGKKKVTIRFNAAPGSETAAVFGIRIIRGIAR